MFSTNEVFIKSLPKTALMLGKNLGIRVRFVSGVIPETDCHSEIRLPLLKEDADIGDRKAFLGSLVHECGHVKHTDSSAAQGLRSKMIRHLTNVVEDVRMEKLVQDEYPGSRLLFEAVGRDLLRSREANGSRLDNVQSLFIFYCLFKAETTFGHKTYFQPIMDDLENDPRLTESCKQKAAKVLAKELANLTGTRDSVELARKLKQIFDKEIGEDLSSDDEESSAQSAPKTEPDEISSESSVAPGAGGSAPESFKFDDRLDASSKFKRLLEDSSLQEESQEQQTVDPDEAIACSKGNSDYVDPHDQIEGLRIITKSRQNCAGLRRTLSALVESSSRDASVTCRSGKKVDSARIYRLSKWDLRVFKKASEAKTSSTAFHILLDISGSMSGSRGSIALDCALSLFEAVSRIPKTNPALSVFPNVQGFSAENRARRTIVPHGAKRLAAYAENIGGIRFFNGTPMLAALKQVRMIMKLLKEDRKIVFVITDGGFCELKDKIEELKGQFNFDGVELAAIGISPSLVDTATLQLFYGKNFVTIDDASQLRSAVSELAKRLVKEK